MFGGTEGELPDRHSARADWKADMENVADPSSCLIWYQDPVQDAPNFSHSPKKQADSVEQRAQMVLESVCV